MANPIQQPGTQGPNIEEAFLADRQVFWSRFTHFTTGSVIAVVLSLIAMWVFIV